MYIESCVIVFARFEGEVGGGEDGARRRRRGLHVYINVSQIFPKNNFSNLCITIVILETVKL